MVVLSKDESKKRILTSIIGVSRKVESESICHIDNIYMYMSTKTHAKSRCT
jgi:hypothetical protein